MTQAAVKLRVEPSVFYPVLVFTW